MASLPSDHVTMFWAVGNEKRWCIKSWPWERGWPSFAPLPFCYWWCGSGRELSRSKERTKGHPNLKPESQCAREVTEFWQLLFNVFDVYSVHLLSEYILNSLLTHLSYSSPVPPIHFLHRQNSNVLLCHSDHRGILGFFHGLFQGLPHALKVKSQFLSRTLFPSLLLPSTPQAEYSRTPVPSRLWASAWASFCLGPSLS